MKVVVEYLRHPHNTYRARLISTESESEGVAVDSIECINKAEAVEVVGTYNTFRDTQLISLETALERVRNNTSPTWEEVFLANLRAKYSKMFKEASP